MLACGYILQYLDAECFKHMQMESVCEGLHMQSISHLEAWPSRLVMWQVLKAAQRLGIKTVRGNWDENSLAAVRAAKHTGAYEVLFPSLTASQMLDACLLLKYLQSVTEQF